MKQADMRHFILKIAFFLISISILGCSSDDSSPSECPELTCFNGGIFQDCGCNCPEGYLGTNCETQITPSKVLITNIRVKSFPNQDMGSNWDFNGLPDIYTDIENQSGTLYSSETYFIDAISNGVNYFDFTISPAFGIANVTLPHYITLWDYDLEDIPSSDDDYMAITAFYPYEASRGFPTTLILSSNPQFQVELSLSYEW